MKRRIIIFMLMVAFAIFNVLTAYSAERGEV